MEQTSVAPSTSDHPIRLRVTDDLQRNRLTVFFRLILAIPHIFWVLLWGVITLLAWIVNWFATLIMGRSPDGLHTFLAGFLRYFTHVRHLSHDQVQKFVTLDYHDDFALIGLVPHEGRERMVCVGRYFRQPGTNDAEVAITVHDDFQRLGIGTYLLGSLVQIARENGLDAFTADVLGDNRGMMQVFHKIAGEMEVTLEAGIYHLRFELARVKPGKRTAQK